MKINRLTYSNQYDLSDWHGLLRTMPTFSAFYWGILLNKHWPFAWSGAGWATSCEPISARMFSSWRCSLIIMDLWIIAVTLPCVNNVRARPPFYLRSNHCNACIKTPIYSSLRNAENEHVYVYKVTSLFAIDANPARITVALSTQAVVWSRYDACRSVTTAKNLLFATSAGPILITNTIWRMPLFWPDNSIAAANSCDGHMYTKRCMHSYTSEMNSIYYSTRNKRTHGCI